MTEALPPIVGYSAIARELARALERSVDVRTVRRWSHADAQKRPKNLRQRLPALKYPDGRVYLLREDLEAWARAWKAQMPTGGKPPGSAAA
jgi:hypothetical protein